MILLREERGTRHLVPGGSVVAVRGGVAARGGRPAPRIAGGYAAARRARYSR
jgi:hypothetical protein